MTTILDYLIAIGEIKDPDVERAENIEFRRSRHRFYFRRMPDYLKPYRRHYGDRIEMGLEPDHERNRIEHELRINTAPKSVMDFFTPAEVYKLSGVFVRNPELWGGKLPKDFKSDIL